GRVRRAGAAGGNEPTRAGGAGPEARSGQTAGRKPPTARARLGIRSLTGSRYAPRGLGEARGLGCKASWGGRARERPFGRVGKVGGSVRQAEGRRGSDRSPAGQTAGRS